MAPGGRPALQRKAVAARVGSETRLRDALQDVPIQSLVTDGQMDVSGVAPYRGRCRWHVPRTVRFRFYDDNVAGERNEELTGSIRGVAYADLRQWPCSKGYTDPVVGSVPPTGPEGHGRLSSERLRASLSMPRRRGPSASSRPPRPNGRCGS